MGSPKLTISSLIPRSSFVYAWLFSCSASARVINLRLFLATILISFFLPVYVVKKNPRLRNSSFTGWPNQILSLVPLSYFYSVISHNGNIYLNIFDLIAIYSRQCQRRWAMTGQAAVKCLCLRLLPFSLIKLLSRNKLMLQHSFKNPKGNHQSFFYIYTNCSIFHTNNNR